MQVRPKPRAARSYGLRLHGLGIPIRQHSRRGTHGSAHRCFPDTHIFFEDLLYAEAFTRLNADGTELLSTPACIDFLLQNVGELSCILRCEYKTRTAMLDDLRHTANARDERRNSMCVTFIDHATQRFFPHRRHDECIDALEQFCRTNESQERNVRSSVSSLQVSDVSLIALAAEQYRHLLCVHAL